MEEHTDNELERLLSENRIVVERYIHYRIRKYFDAEDVIQNTYLQVCKNFETQHSEK